MKDYLYYYITLFIYIFNSFLIFDPYDTYRIYLTLLNYVIVIIGTNNKLLLNIDYKLSLLIINLYEI